MRTPICADQASPDQRSVSRIAMAFFRRRRHEILNGKDPDGYRDADPRFAGSGDVFKNIFDIALFKLGDLFNRRVYLRRKPDGRPLRSYRDVVAGKPLLSAAGNNVLSGSGHPRVTLLLCLYPSGGARRMKRVIVLNFPFRKRHFVRARQIGDAAHTGACTNQEFAAGPALLINHRDIE